MPVASSSEGAQRMKASCEIGRAICRISQCGGLIGTHTTPADMRFSQPVADQSIWRYVPPYDETIQDR